MFFQSSYTPNLEELLTTDISLLEEKRNKFK
jgi:hypothetical protein